MDEKYQMGAGDGLERSKTSEKEKTRINPSLRTNLLRKGIKEAIDFYGHFFSDNYCDEGVDQLVGEYEELIGQARELGLLQKGGIREKYHLSLWCLGRVLSPELYIESGVFIGSSLHAFLRIPGMKRIIAIDPDLDQLKITAGELSQVTLVDKFDFSELELDNIPERSLVFFDDHINTAQRILQSYDKGLKYLLFDDSTGVEGICQRLYPAVPTIPMIVNNDAFRVGDYMEWVYEKPYVFKTNFGNIIKQYIGYPGKNKTKIRYQIDEHIINECKEAKQLIKNYTKIPDLGVFIPQTYPERMPDTTKYLIELYQ